VSSVLPLGGRPLGPPMLCKTVDVVPEDAQHLASVKYDGWRMRAVVGHDTVQLSTREGHTITSVPYVARAVLAAARPGTVLDGELVDLARPRQLKRTSSLLAAHEQHEPSAASPPLTYAVFDILFCAGEDLRDRPLRERLEALRDLFDSDAGREHTSPLLDGGNESALLLVEHRPCSAAYAQQVIDAGHEGVVIKHPEALYRHGARDAGWWRFKPQSTVEVECAGFAPAAGREQVGSITFRLPSGVEGRASSGISDREWQDMTEHPERYVGMLIELAHHGEERSGALRHPVYRGVRDPRDKAATPQPATGPARAVPSGQALATAIAGGARNPRNYRAMGDGKLLTSIRQLRAGKGDAYDRCLERGSGDPAGDLQHALEIAGERGLSA
jgi:ATP-dependent DNA ligase